MQTGGGSASAAGGAKPGLASLMRRAVQQAKADAAAQASADQALALNKGQAAASQKAPEASANGKRALAAMLRKAAQKMQKEEAESATDAVLSASVLAQAAARDSQQDQEEQKQSEISLHDHQLKSQDAALDPDQLRLSSLSQASSTQASGEHEVPSPDSANRAYRQQSLGNRLGSVLKGMLSLPRQSAYLTLDADDYTEAEGADESSGQAPPGTGGRPSSFTGLGQRLGSFLQGAGSR